MMTNKILRLKDLIAYIGLSRSVIYDRMNASSDRFDPTFPKSFPLGGKAIGWSLDDVDAWLARCAGENLPTPLEGGSQLPRQLATQYGDVNSRLQVPTSAKPKVEPANLLTLSDLIVKGGQINATLNQLLTLQAWTPAMGSMIISGVYPEAGSRSIPDEALGLDGKTLKLQNARLRLARCILNDWKLWAEDEILIPSELKPGEFINWCIDNAITSEWLKLCLEFWGIRDQDTPSLTAVRFASLTSN